MVIWWQFIHYKDLDLSDMHFFTLHPLHVELDYSSYRLFFTATMRHLMCTKTASKSSPSKNFKRA